MQLPWLTIFVNTVPVKQPIGRVAGLLDFSNHEARADGVYGPCLEEDAIADGWFKLVQALVACAGGQLELEGRAVLLLVNPNSGSSMGNFGR